MKKIFLLLLSVAALAAFSSFTSSAQAESVNGKCVFESGKDQYFCSADAETQAPAGCTAQIIQTPALGMYCNKVPAGYSAPAIHVSVSSDSSQAAVGTRPVISWQASNTGSDPTTCTILGVDGWSAAGSMTAPAITGSSPVTYTVSCHNGSNSASGSTVVAISNPPTQPSAPAPAVVTSNCPPGRICYTPLEPLPGLANTSDLNFAQLLNAVFKILITVGALFAVVTLVWGGISYVLSGATGEMGEAKKRMTAAIYGLLLLSGSWLILHTINPDLLTFDLNIPGQPQNTTPIPLSGPGAGTSGTITGGGAANSTGASNQGGTGTGAAISGSASGTAGNEAGGNCAMGINTIFFFPANTPCGQDLSGASDAQGTLTDGREYGKAIMLADFQSGAPSDLSNQLNLFTNDCKQSSGHVRTVHPKTNGTVTGYLCIQ